MKKILTRTFIFLSIYLIFSFCADALGFNSGIYETPFKEDSTGIFAYFFTISGLSVVMGNFLNNSFPVDDYPPIFVSLQISLLAFLCSITSFFLMGVIPQFQIFLIEKEFFFVNFINLFVANYYAEIYTKKAEKV